MAAFHSASDWAEATFSNAKLGDNRRTKRLVERAGRMANSTGHSFSSAWLGTPSETS